MINGIQDQPHQFLQMVNQLRTSARPIALYGAGEVAEKVHGILNQQNLTIDAVWVDQVSQPGSKFKGLPVQEIGTITDINAYSVIVCIGNYREALKKLKTRYHAEHIFLIDNIYSLPPITYSYLEEHLKGFSTFYESLCDARSQETFVAYMNARISGDPSPLFDYYDPHQYFPSDIPGYPNLKADEVFVDCGAFTGDTLSEFAKITQGSYQKIFAFEPDEKNHQLMLKTIQKEQIPNVVPVKKGVASARATFRFTSRDISSQISEDGTTTIEVDRIDSVIGDAPVSFLKMDVEGYELEALHGAENAIRTHRPKLAISVYHKPEDLFSIPEYLRSLVPGYRFYLRAHKCMSIDLVLYALP